MRTHLLLSHLHRRNRHLLDQSMSPEPRPSAPSFIAEWVQLQKERKKANKRKEVSAQLAQKPQGGRPSGGISAAARDLGLPRDTVRRAVRIASLSDAAKAEAKALGLDDNQSAARCGEGKRGFPAASVAMPMGKRPESGVFMECYGQGPICHEVNLERSVFRSDGGRRSSIGARGALIQIIAWRPRGIHFLEKCCIPQPGCRADEASAMRRSFT
jgi:ParB family chromosome partitioning protein